MKRVKFLSANGSVSLDHLSNEINTFIDEGKYDLVSVTLTKTDDKINAVVATIIYDDREYMSAYTSRKIFNG